MARSRRGAIQLQHLSPTEAVITCSYNRNRKRNRNRNIEISCVYICKSLSLRAGKAQVSQGIDKESGGEDGVGIGEVSENLVGKPNALNAHSVLLSSMSVSILFSYSITVYCIIIVGFRARNKYNTASHVMSN